ncbi:hypothetical protein BGZ60DRAFT_560156 [Tricladium varicosporioides]|nr:hypothetical protein BGZ60DRAFT_560156 [Hymenoscyphus varicosporioides]
MPPKRKNPAKSKGTSAKELLKLEQTRESLKYSKSRLSQLISERVLAGHRKLSVPRVSMGFSTSLHSIKPFHIPKPTLESDPLPSRSETPPVEPPALEFLGNPREGDGRFSTANSMFTIWENYKVNGRLSDAQIHSVDLIVSNAEQRFTKLDKGAARWLNRKAEFNGNKAGEDGESGNEDEDEAP